MSRKPNLLMKFTGRQGEKVNPRKPLRNYHLKGTSQDAPVRAGKIRTLGISRLAVYIYKV